jgi:hypothetical protein
MDLQEKYCCIYILIEKYCKISVIPSSYITHIVFFSIIFLKNDKK